MFINNEEGTKQMTILHATIDPIKTPLFGVPEKWALIFHTDQGREEFGTYRTKADARADAKKYGIKVVILLDWEIQYWEDFAQAS